MPYSAEHKEGTRQRIVTSAARLFNRKGFAEVTISEIMTAAGLTHGGFYRHFRTKDELYSEVISQFLCRPAEPWQQKPAERCVPGQPFARYVVDAYLSREHLDDVDGSCLLIGLPSDAARGGEAVKTAYRQVTESMIRLFEANLSGPEAREQAPRLCRTLCRRHAPGARHRRQGLGRRITQIRREAYSRYDRLGARTASLAEYNTAPAPR
jgi:TetR/AcrR family transcriptional repressor of nem operon